MKSRKGPPGGKRDKPKRRPQGKPEGYGRKDEAEGPKKRGSGRPSGSKARQEGPGDWKAKPKPGTGTPYAGKGSKPPAFGGPKPFPGKPHAGTPYAGKGAKPPTQAPGGKTFPPSGGGRPFQKKQRLDAPPSKEELGRLMSKYGVNLQSKTLEKLWGYHQLLRAHNGDQDLTRLIGFDTIAQRHYADCMILHGMMGGKWPSPLVDVGSGAGFPGIMIKLMSPETTIVLAEPRPRRVVFLEMVIRELGLRNITVFGHKVTSRSLTQPFAGVITRAFETVESTLPRLGGCLGVGGQAIFMKGPKVAEEMATFANDEYKVLRNQAYRIPNTVQDRVLVILERTKVPEPGTEQPFDPAEEADFAGPEPEDA